jgi:hypothetical protein
MSTVRKAAERAADLLKACRCGPMSRAELVIELEASHQTVDFWVRTFVAAGILEPVAMQGTTGKFILRFSVAPAWRNDK